MKKFKTITAAEILSKELAEIPFVIEHLLPNGLSLLAGSPKVGKSWFALWLSIQIANGEKVFDFETAKGTVLFLALEDNEIRIQNRLLEIIDIAPDNIHFCTEISKLGGELETRIKNFVCENQNTKLIIIDTLQTVRTGTESSYASDYSDLMILKKLADEYGIAILLIHHFRKQKDSDTFHQISGSTGLQGVVDTMFTMTQSKRGEKASVLNCIGRDIEPREMEMERTDENCWIKLSDSLSETTLSDLNFINAVDIFMSDKVIFSGSATELSSLLNAISDENFSNKVISKNIKRLSKRFEKLGILGVSRRSNGKRIVELIRVGDDSVDGK
ncbi:AAA family ATPase [Chakrabartyella piscis]|uniref:AAA family ATPase n=1 Tax=Chakrabartyella piscis TaxID=2918914 RepID=UPI002958AC1B|nr:AAA family ATPase [Chakrabartyella piscis]